MSQADRDTLEALREAADAVDGDAKKKLAALAAKYVPEIIAAAKRVMDDVESRQSLNAAAFLAELATGVDASGAGKGEVRVVVLQASDVQRLGEMQRSQLKQVK